MKKNSANVGENSHLIFLAIIINVGSLLSIYPDIREDLSNNLSGYLFQISIVALSILLFRLSDKLPKLLLLVSVIAMIGAITSAKQIGEVLVVFSVNKIIIPFSLFAYWIYVLYALKIGEDSKENIISTAFERYHSKYPDITDFNTICELRTCCFSRREIVTVTRLKEWLLITKYNFTIVFDESLKAIAYWNCLLITKDCYQKLKLGDIHEDDIKGNYLVNYNTSCEYYIYIAAVCASKKIKSDSVAIILSLSEHISIVHKSGNLKGICAWAINENTKVLLKKMGFTHVENSKEDSMFCLEFNDIDKSLVELKRLRNRMNVMLPNRNIKEYNDLRRKIGI